MVARMTSLELADTLGLEAAGRRGPDGVHSLFHGRTAVLATRHGKERVIAPAIEPALGIDLVVPAEFDTDRFGTFTREVPRVGTQREAARRKALAALEQTGHDLAIASEGSFGPHPAVPFLTANIELVVLVDRVHDLEIVGTHVATETQTGHRWVDDPEDALAFARSVGFPDHGIIVRRGPDDPAGIVKELADAAALCAAVRETVSASQERRAFLEVDLRAHRNPTRMKAIAAAAADLVANALRRCPDCGTPGFAHVDSEPGLPCRWCRLPTEYVRLLIYGCSRCDARRELPRPDGRVFADPGECPRCNP
jgi:hypothetical protein